MLTFSHTYINFVTELTFTKGKISWDLQFEWKPLLEFVPRETA
jgi:hypothetical protein